jgi:hypothetical protein
MAATQNSISSLIAQFLRLQTNALEIVQGLNQVATSTNETVQIQILDENGTPRVVSVPGFGFLQNQIDRLDNNIQALSGLGTNASTVRNADGTYSQIYKAQPLSDPPALNGLNVPSTFGAKNNWFFESFLTPLLYVQIDLTNQITNLAEKERLLIENSDRILCRRIIANTVTDEDKAFFDSNLKGRNDLSYSEFVGELQAAGINFFVDEDILQLPLRRLVNVGTFSVLGVYDDVVTVFDANGVPSQETRRNYTLDTLNYTDVTTGIQGGKTLDTNDLLATQDGSRYRIVSINRDQGSIQVTRISGYQPISIGQNTLTFVSQQFSAKVIDVNVGYDERQGIFFKTLDDNFNLIGSQWSTGVTFWSSELTINTPDGVVTLEQYYNTQVADIGKIFFGMAKENKISAIQGLVPNVPEVNSSDFKVVQINKQLTDNTSTAQLTELIAQKSQLKSEIDELDQAINRVRGQVNTLQSSSSLSIVPASGLSSLNSSLLTSTGQTINANLSPISLTQPSFNQVADPSQLNSLQSQLNSLTIQRSQKSQLYDSIVQSIRTSAIDTPQLSEAPKYRVRGFWPIPDPKNSPETGPQSVIQFQVRYRYLSVSGAVQPTEQIEFLDNNGERKTGAFSNWIVYKSDIRKKIYDVETGTYQWADENPDNADEVNVNQLDIPITKGEQLEIQISSISEAGWPDNPLVSPYSNSVIINFPENLNTLSPLSTVLDNTTDQALVIMKQELSAQGLNQHLSEQFETNNKTFYHTSNGIASGFFGADGSVINLYQKLLDLQNQVDALRAVVNQEVGELSVEIISSDLQIPAGSVSPGSTISLEVPSFASQFQNPLTTDAGKISTTTLSLKISNIAASPLELASLLPGSLGVKVSDSTPSLPGYAQNLRYEDVPISQRSLEPSDILGPTGSPDNTSTSQAPPYASANLFSQWMYPRYKSVGGDQTLYVLNTSPFASNYDYAGAIPVNGNQLIPHNPALISPSGPLSGGVNPSVWSGGYTGATGSKLPIGNGPLSEFCIHVGHPDLITGGGAAFSELVKPNYSNGSIVYPAFRQSLYFQTDINENNYYQQLGYRQVNTPFVTGPSGSSRTDSMYAMKLGFEQDDEFLIGKYSCGSYLFLAPSTNASIQVPGTTSLSSKLVGTGTASAIIVPVIFQFRPVDKLGYIGGFRLSGNLNNVAYSKTIGIDIKPRFSSTFSFDIKVTGRYKTDNLRAPLSGSSSF